MCEADDAMIAGWPKRFADPIILPDGRKLRDAATYVIKLPAASAENRHCRQRD